MIYRIILLQHKNSEEGKSVSQEGKSVSEEEKSVSEAGKSVLEAGEGVPKVIFPLELPLYEGHFFGHMGPSHSKNHEGIKKSFGEKNEKLISFPIRSPF